MGIYRYDSSQHGQDHLIYTSKMKAAVAALLLVVATTEAYDYCQISKCHELCGKQGVGRRCWNTLEDGLGHEVDQASKDWIVKKHNELRSKVALGHALGQPQAADMEEMSWDDELAEIAQAYANKCMDGHDSAICRSVKNGRFSTTGQNIAKIWGGWGDRAHEAKVDFPAAMDKWYEQQKFVSRFALSYFKEGQASSTYGTKDVDSYTQLVWAKSNKVGCGYIMYEDSTGYGPVGMRGHFLPIVHPIVQPIVHPILHMIVHPIVHPIVDSIVHPILHT